MDHANIIVKLVQSLNSELDAAANDRYLDHALCPAVRCGGSELSHYRGATLYAASTSF